MIVFDSARRLIILDSTSVTATELYSRSIDWLASGDNAKYDAVFRTAGGDDLGGGLSIPPYFFLQGSWRVKPVESDQTLTINGNLFVDGDGDPVVPTDGVFQVLVKTVVPVQAQGISTSGGSSITVGDIEASIILAKKADVLAVPAAVRANLVVELDRIDAAISSISSGALSATQATMLLEMYNLLGLDPTKPLIVTETSRTAGAITQDIATTATETIVSRI